MICSVCNSGLQWDLQIGRYVHVNGGGAIIQHCVDCKFVWNSSPPKSVCPKCGSGVLRDDHIASPRREYQNMKKTQQSFNNTLKMGSCELKRRPIKQISCKRKAQNAQYAELRDRLFLLASGFSEYASNKGLAKMTISCSKGQLEPHHIDGKQGKRLIDPFNIIICTTVEHCYFQAHNSYEQRQRLLAIVRPIRLAQGFREVV